MTSEFQLFKKYRYEMFYPHDFQENPQGFRGISTHNYSDICAHLPILELIARNCETVTEFGTRDCFSTVAFLAGARQKVTSYDIVITGAIAALKNIKTPVPWEFIQENTIDPQLKIAETDFLFIDSLHTYNQVKQELKQHSDRAKRYLGFHDTFSCWDISREAVGGEGIGRAITDFLTGGEWKKIYEVKFNHGLLIVERI